MDDPRLVIGNFVGLISTIFAFLSYQAKTAKKLLALQNGIVLTMIASYAILGAWSGMALVSMCLFRNISYREDTKVRLFRHKAWPYVLAVLLGGVGACSWQGPISLFAIVALMINTVFLSLGDNRKLRFSILLTSSMIIVYDFVFRAYLPMLMESVAIVSSAIALVRYRDEK